MHWVGEIARRKSWVNPGERLTWVAKPNSRFAVYAVRFPRNYSLRTTSTWKNNNCRILSKSIDEFIRAVEAETAVYRTRNEMRNFAARRCSATRCRKHGTIYVLEWKVLPRAAYSPDLAGPSTIVFFEVFLTPFVGRRYPKMHRWLGSQWTTVILWRWNLFAHLIYI